MQTNHSLKFDDGFEMKTPTFRDQRMIHINLQQPNQKPFIAKVGIDRGRVVDRLFDQRGDRIGFIDDLGLGGERHNSFSFPQH